MGEIFVGRHFGQGVFVFLQLDGEHVDILCQAVVLVIAVDGHAIDGAGVASQNGEQHGDGLISGGEGGNPFVEVCQALLVRQLLPEIIGRQIKRAGAAGHQHALFDGHQPFVFAQMLAEFLLYALQVFGHCLQLLQLNRLG